MVTRKTKRGSRRRYKKRLPRRKQRGGSTTVPIVIISWNNYTFLKNFIDQIKKYANPIIVLDNKSSYPPLLKYYDDIKAELGDKIDIRRLDQNYGHTVYMQIKDTLPSIYILTDPDVELNAKLPTDFTDTLVALSEKYQAYKVGFALDLSDKEKFIKCDNYTQGKSIYDWESQYWNNRITDDKYELYDAAIDTTFCLINNKYSGGKNIRIAGDFTARHLPWYEGYIKNHIPQDEIDFWKKENKSSSILFNCLKL
jgi:hypothetical protein